MRTHHNRLWTGAIRATLLAATSLCIGAAATGALAQTERRDTIEEILVTATKRGVERLQEVPLTIQALSGDLLNSMGARNFADYAGLVPGLAYQDQGPGDKRFIVRGIQSSGAGTVGVYFDETVVTGGSSEDGGGRYPEIKLYDMERIEILKGPQGTLYGASSMSGAIRMVTNKPNTTQYEANVEGSVSQTAYGGGNYDAAVMGNIPLVADRLAVRAVGWSVSNSGYIDNILLKVSNTNFEHVNGGRGSLLWNASDDLTFTASVLHQEMKLGSNSRWNIALPRFKSDDYSRTPWNETMSIYSASLNYDAKFADIVATTNYFKRDMLFRFDITRFLAGFGITTPTVTSEPQNRRIFSNEIRMSTKLDGPLQAVVGAFYQSETRNFENRSIKIDAVGNPIISDGLDDPVVNSAYIFGRRSYSDLSQYAVFGEVTYNITDQFKALVGLRHFHSRQIETGRTYFPFGGIPAAGPPAANPDLNGIENKLTKKFSLSYQITPDQLVYALYSEGFRPGGLNSQGFFTVTAIPPKFGPDQIRNYEVGFKADWLEHRLRTNLSVESLDWLDMQVRQVDAVTRLPFLSNAARAKVTASELEVEALPTEGLRLSGSLGYSFARLTQDQPPVVNSPGTAGLKGDLIPNVPKWTASATAEYTFPIGSALSGVVAGDLKYRSSTATAFRPTDRAFLTLQPYTVFDLRAGVQGDQWSAMLYVNNVSNKLTEQDKRIESYPSVTIYSTRPRTVGLRLQHHF